MAKSKMSERVKEAIINSLAITGKYSKTAELFKLDVSTIYKVRLQDPEFAEQTANAIAASRVNAVEQVFDIERNAALTGYYTYLKPVKDPLTGVINHVTEYEKLDPTVRRKALESIKLDNARYFGTQRAATVINNNTANALGNNIEQPLEEPVLKHQTSPEIKQKLADLRDAIKKSQSPDHSNFTSQ